MGCHLGEIDKSKYTKRKSSLPVDRCFVVMGANGHVACGAAETHTNMKTGKKEEIWLKNMTRCIKYLPPKCEDQNSESTISMNARG